jgi:hypothetical protein
MASSYSKYSFDELDAEEEDLVTEKEDFGSRSPIRRERPSQLIWWIVGAALVVSIGTNASLWWNSRTSSPAAHQMFCESTVEPVVDRISHTDGATLSSCHLSHHL